MGDDELVGAAEELLRRERWPYIREKLAGACDEIVDFSRGDRSYSFRYVAQMLSPSPTVGRILDALDSSDDFATAIGSLIRQVIAPSSLTPSAEQVGLLFRTITVPISTVRKHAINPFVQVVREEGEAEAYLQDRYGEFKRRWNGLVERIEGLGEQVKVKLDLSMNLAPDLLVPPKKH